MYMKPWVQKLILQIQQFLQAQAKAGWLDIGQNKPQRVLDYACGNGTVSGVRQISNLSYSHLALIKNSGAPRLLPQRHFSWS
jgi:hypothetical protein